MGMARTDRVGHSGSDPDATARHVYPTRRCGADASPSNPRAIAPRSALARLRPIHRFNHHHIAYSEMQFEIAIGALGRIEALLQERLYCAE